MLDKLSRLIAGTETKISFTQQIISLLGWLGVLSIGTAASWKATMTEWMNIYGPAGAIIFGLLMAGAAAFVFRITASAINALADARLKLGYAQRSGSVNPLKNSFEGEVVNISDFYSPGPMIYKDKVFRNCEIRGPGTIFLHASNPGSGRMQECIIDISVIETTNPQIDARCTVVFVDSVFLHCTLYRVTLIGPPGLRQLVGLAANPPIPNTASQLLQGAEA